MKILLSKLWNGKISLWKTYWLLGLVPLIWIIPVEIFYSEDKDYAIYGLSLLMNLVFEIFWFICVWRAANKYMGKIYWYYLSKLSAILFIIMSIFDAFEFGGLF